MKNRADSANVRFPPPLIYLAALLAGIFVGRAVGVPELAPNSFPRDATGAILLLVGMGLSVAGAGRFRSAGTAVIPHKPATHLVTSGLYGWTRNPMYLGMGLAYAGVAVLTGSLLALLFLPFVLFIIQTQVIAREEAYLERAFGSEYRRYRQHVRRWL